MEISDYRKPDLAMNSWKVQMEQRIGSKYLRRHSLFCVNLVRPAGFEPAAYGFVVRASEFPNLLILL